ncbi:hypothetical protein, partial [Corynebacterium parakroppenstedtii]|uniref:hypothetical protein n=1 Tax=Corynebacterium parakroppenstedtii TaxID=2828363 RepID=UPI001F350EFC
PLFLLNNTNLSRLYSKIPSSSSLVCHFLIQIRLDRFSICRSMEVFFPFVLYIAFDNRFPLSETSVRFPFLSTEVG